MISTRGMPPALVMTRALVAALTWGMTPTRGTRLVWVAVPSGVTVLTWVTPPAGVMVLTRPTIQAWAPARPTAPVRTPRMAPTRAMVLTRPTVRAQTLVPAWTPAPVTSTGTAPVRHTGRTATGR